MIKADPYSFLEHHHAGKPTGNPVAKNPCSFESVYDVFKTINSETTGDVRKLTIVGCDGLPYLIGNKVRRQEEDLKTSFLSQGLVTQKLI